MRLRYSPTSPYVRKVTTTAHELGLFDRLELVPTNAWDPASDLPADNPLGKVPTLLLEDGEVLYDSPVICAYLDSLAGDRLLPVNGAARWQTLRNEALADGVLDAAVLVFIERGKRDEDQRSAWWEQLQLDAVARALDAMEGYAGSLGTEPDLGQLTFACALGYLDFRFPELGWRQGRAALDGWYAAFASRPSLQATIPRDPA
jgi:glutathione S-transferase